MLFYIHIPKTGGTALKHLEHQTRKLPFQVAKRHFITLDSLKNLYDKQALIVLRDPVDRFCSGFWERKTMPLRRDMYETHYKKILPSHGYADYSAHEVEILEKLNTPNDLVDWMRENNRDPSGTLGELTAPLTQWLGTFNEYIKNEHMVEVALDIENLTAWVKATTGLDLHDDAFRRRGREQFDFEQSYELSEENLEYFKNSREEDYRLIEHIRKSRYFYRPL